MCVCESEREKEKEREFVSVSHRCSKMGYLGCNCIHFFSIVYPADKPEGNNTLPTTTGAATSTAAFTAPPTLGSGGTGTGGGGGATAGGAGQATALFPCLVYYPGSQNYSLIWVPMDGSNPIVSGANILSGSGALTIPTQVIADC